MSGDVIRRSLEWRVEWKELRGGQWEHRTRTFTDIDALKRYRQALFALARCGDVSEISTSQRYASIPATKWVQPDWVRASKVAS